MADWCSVPNFAGKIAGSLDNAIRARRNLPLHSRQRRRYRNLFDR
jgi:hypothetical protein